MSVLGSWLASPPPDAAIEIGADRVAAAVVVPRGGAFVVSAHAVEALPRGVVAPSLTAANVSERGVVLGALRRVLDQLGTRPRRIALVVPDSAVKVSLLRFDKVPPRRDDFEQLVRWQLRKATPFPVDTASVTSTPGLEFPDGGREFVVELARHEGVREYEGLCEDLGMYPGLVDTATFSLLGLFADEPASDRDWLLVHVRPDYTSIVILRGDAVIFFRNRPGDGEEGLPDLVYQTSMYYQDRLAGGAFARVLLAGRTPGAADTVRRALEQRLGVAVEPLDPGRAAALTDRIGPSPDLVDALGPAIGLLRRTYNGVRA
jgi:Tfp pilus assembly PilM family ATPase